jgi:hypothetical protein
MGISASRVSSAVAGGKRRFKLQACSGVDPYRWMTEHHIDWDAPLPCR